MFSSARVLADMIMMNIVVEYLIKMPKFFVSNIIKRKDSYVRNELAQKVLDGFG